MELERVSSHCADSTVCFDSEWAGVTWAALPLPARKGRWHKDDGLALCLQCFTTIRLMYCQWPFDPIRGINQVCLAFSLPLDY